MTRTRFVLAGLGLLASGLVAAGGSHYVKVLAEAQLGQSWVPDPKQPRVLAGYPEAAPDRRIDACVNLGYLIGTDGKTSKFVELMSWSSASGDKAPSEEAIAPYAQIAAAVLARRRYAPVGDKPLPVFTSESFAFAGSGQVEREALAERCRIRDLQALLGGEGGQRIRQPLLKSRYETGIKRGFQCSSFSVYCSMLEGD